MTTIPKPEITKLKEQAIKNIGASVLLSRGYISSGWRSGEGNWGVYRVSLAFEEAKLQEMINFVDDFTKSKNVSKDIVDNLSINMKKELSRNRIDFELMARYKLDVGTNIDKVHQKALWEHLVEVSFALVEKYFPESTPPLQLRSSPT